MIYIKKIIILFSLIIFGITLAQEKGYKEVQLTTNNSDNRYASYSKDGSVILFESNRDGNWQIYSMDADGSNQKRLFKSDANDRRPTFHPDKNSILFESNRTGTNEIYTFNGDTQSIKKIPIKLSGNKSYAKYFSNGIELVFCYEEKEGNTSIYRVHKKGKLMKKLVSNDYLNRYPKPNRRGDVVLYYSNKNNIQETDVVYSYNVLLKGNYQLTLFKDDSKDAAWPNKSNRVVFSYINKKASATSEIYVMQRDGSRKRRVTFNNQNDILPHWSPNEIDLLVTREGENNQQIFKILLKEEL